MHLTSKLASLDSFLRPIYPTDYLTPLLECFTGILQFTGTNQPLIFSFGVKYLSKCAFFCPAVPTINLGTFSHTSPSPSFVLFSKTSALLLKQLNIILSPSLLLQVQCKPSSSSLISLLTNTFFFTEELQ